MQKVLIYLKTYLLSIISTILISVFFSFLIFPALISSKYANGILTITSLDTFIAITAIVLLLLTLSWNKANDLWQRYKNTYRLEKPFWVYLDYIYVFIILSVLLIYFFQRRSIPNQSFEFELFASINFFLVICWFFSSYLWKGQKRENKSSANVNIDLYSLSDEPIERAEQDLLERTQFIDDLYKEIINFPLNDSFVFGLFSSWGEGKTSVINLLKKRFKENNKFLLVNFEPWHFKDEDAILVAFYRQVEGTINEKFIVPGLRRTFTKYQKILSAGISQVGLNIDLSFPNESIEEIKKRIEFFVAKINKKIFIIIDDIDRLQPEESLAIFKLVRLNAKFKNTIFLLSFDQLVVKKYLKKSFEIDTEYLEKLVQKPIQLPTIEQKQIDQFFDVHLHRLFDKTAIPEAVIKEFDKEFYYIYQTQIRKLVKTLRQAKRFLNGLLSTFPLIKDEVNFYDYFILEAISIFYPKVFSDIWRNPWFYIPANWDVKTSLMSPFNFASDEKEKYSRIKEHIENLAKDEQEPEILKELLKAIFFVEVKNAFDVMTTDYSNSAIRYRAEQRITHPECFKKYFMLQVPSAEISDEFVKTTLDLWNAAEKDKREKLLEKTIFDLQKKEKLLEILQKLNVFKNNISKELSLSIIDVLYKNANKLSKKGTEDFWNSEYDKAEMLIIILINDKIEKNQIQNKLEEIIVETPDLRFAVQVVLSCKQASGGGFYNIYESMQIEELQNKVAGRLKKYFVDEKRDIFEEFQDERDWGFVLYQWASNWMTFLGNNSKTVNSYINSLLNEDVKRFTKFLVHWRNKEREGALVFRLNEFIKIYDIDEFEKLAQKFVKDKNLLKEEKELIEQFLVDVKKKSKINQGQTLT